MVWARLQDWSCRWASLPGILAAPAPRRRGRPPLPRGPADPYVPDDIRGAVARLKRERIVASAVELFYRQGYARTTLEQVADAMDVTKPFIYAHFPSKADLLAEICSRAIRHAHEVLNRILVEEGTQTERLERIFSEFLLAVLDNQAAAVIYSREEKELAQADRDKPSTASWSPCWRPGWPPRNSSSRTFRWLRSRSAGSWAGPRCGTGPTAA